LPTQTLFCLAPLNLSKVTDDPLELPQFLKVLDEFKPFLGILTSRFLPS